MSEHSSRVAWEARITVADGFRFGVGFALACVLVWAVVRAVGVVLAWMSA